MVIGMVPQIIKESVNNNILNNIFNITDPKEMRKKLQVACLQFGQDIIYFILQKLFNYP